MTAHISFPKLLGNATPATLSPFFLKGILRDEFQFEGFCLTQCQPQASYLPGLAGTGGERQFPRLGTSGTRGTKFLKGTCKESSRTRFPRNGNMEKWGEMRGNGGGGGNGGQNGAGGWGESKG